MDSRALLSGDNNFPNFEVDRGMYGAPGLNPFLGYKNQFSIPYQFPAAASENIYTVGNGGSGGVQFDHHQEPAQGFGLKFGHSGYGSSGGGGAGGGHVIYGPPVMPHKGGKLKGAALSALTLLAFLFFLNLLQSCLKDQMEAMNPTVRLKQLSSSLNVNFFLRR